MRLFGVAGKGFVPSRPRSSLGQQHPAISTSGAGVHRFARRCRWIGFGAGLMSDVGVAHAISACSSPLQHQPVQSRSVAVGVARTIKTVGRLGTCVGLAHPAHH